MKLSRTGYYQGMDKALQLLYTEGSLALVDGGDLFTFDRSIVDKAINKLHKEGCFSPELLDSKEGRALMGENARVLSDGVEAGIIAAQGDGLRHEIPAALTEALQQDVRIFSGWKTYHAMQEAGLSLRGMDGGIKPISEFRKEAGDVFKRQGLNLTAEYNHAVQSAQMAANWHDVEEDGDRYDLQYRTVGDEKVRAAHQALNDTTLPPSDPFWSSYYPPNGWNCRCTAIQVRKGKYPRSDSTKALEAGNAATSSKSEQIFRFNAGDKKRVYPEKHPYLPKGCDGCNTKLKLSKSKNRPECVACEIIQRRACDVEVIPTKNGRVTCAKDHGKHERAENIAIATYFAEKYGQQIELLPRSNTRKMADVYNKTLNQEQEYKLNKTASKNAIDSAIRTACYQSANVVLKIESDISTKILRDGICYRVKRAIKLQTLTIMRNGTDKTYTRAEILADNFEL